MSSEDFTKTLDLVRRAQDGDGEALNRLFDRYQDRVRRIVRLGVFVQSDDRFDGQPKVANGASELMLEASA